MLENISPFLAWLVAASGVMFVGGLLLVPILVVRMRADYFVARAPPSNGWPTLHPILSACMHALKNGLGVVLVLAGIAMLVLPGQGLLTILLGLTLLEFPGKRRLELGLVSRKPVFKTINWMRQRAGRDPLVLPPPETDQQTPFRDGS